MKGTLHSTLHKGYFT